MNPTICRVSDINPTFRRLQIDSCSGAARSLARRWSTCRGRTCMSDAPARVPPARVSAGEKPGLAEPLAQTLFARRNALDAGQFLGRWIADLRIQQTSCYLPPQPIT